MNKPSLKNIVTEDLNTLLLRSQYQTALINAIKTDSKSEDLRFKEDAKNLLQELRKECKHNAVVCLDDYYEGSYIEDYSDKNPEKRICLCCGIIETSWNLNDYKYLKNKPFARIGYSKIRNSFDDCYPLTEPLNSSFEDCLNMTVKFGYRYNL